MTWRANDLVAFDVLTELQSACGALIVQQAASSDAGIARLIELDQSVNAIDPRDRAAVDEAITRLTALRASLQGQ